MLSTGLLIGIGGGAIAAAENDSGGSPAGTQGVDGQNQGANPANGPTGGPENQPTTQQEAGPGDTGTVGSLGAPSEPTTEPGATDSEYEENWAGSAASDSDVPASDSSVIATDSSVAATDPSVLASDSNVPASYSGVPATDSSVAASNSNVVVPATHPVAPVINAFQPVATAFTAVANAVGSVPGTVAALPTSATPITDVITSVQNMLTAVAGTVAPLTQLPSDLYSLLGVPRPAQPLIGSGGASATFAADDAAPLFGPRASQWPQLPSAVWDGPLFGNMTPLPALGTAATTGLLQELSLSGMAPLAPDAVSPAGARSLLEHVVSAVLVPASLTALAALALPGIAGLLVVCAAGMRVGYRQAKAGWALRVSGIARFAGPGPLGVVRSGSLIALHSRAPRAPRASRVVRPEVSPPARHLERVA